MQLEQYMEKFEKELELERPLNKPLPGTFLIPLDVGLILTITHLPNGFTLFCEIVEIPKENEETSYTQLLRANLFGQGTRGSVLGINERGNMLTISRVVDYNIEYKDFKEIIEDFINTVDFWKDQILVN